MSAENSTDTDPAAHWSFETKQVHAGQRPDPATNARALPIPKLGVDVSFAEDPDDLDSWRAAARPNTKAFFAETISNPQIDVLDTPGVAGVAHEHGVPRLAVGIEGILSDLELGFAAARAPQFSAHNDDPQAVAALRGPR